MTWSSVLLPCLQAKLERLLCAFTLDVCDKIARHKLIDDDQGALDAVARQRRQEMDEELKKFKEAEFERLKQEDEWFARDHDVDAKKNETRRQLMAHSLAQVRPSPIYACLLMRPSPLSACLFMQAPCLASPLSKLTHPPRHSYTSPCGRSGRASTGRTAAGTARTATWTWPRGPTTPPTWPSRWPCPVRAHHT